MADLTTVQRVSLTSALEKQIEKLIVDGELAPGDRLYESKLAARFGTSRGPLREATRSLEAKGFVQSIRNRGVFVQQISRDEAFQIYDVRATLLGLAGRLAAQRMTDSLLSSLSRQIEEMDVAAQATDFDAYYPLNLEFHRTILEASGNTILIAEYQRFLQKMHLFRAKSLVWGGGLAVSNLEHREMLKALGSGDPERAFAAHWRHVERAKHRMLTATSDMPDAPKADAAGG